MLLSGIMWNRLAVRTFCFTEKVVSCCFSFFHLTHCSPVQSSWCRSTHSILGCHLWDDRAGHSLAGVLCARDGWHGCVLAWLCGGYRLYMPGEWGHWVHIVPGQLLAKCLHCDLSFTPPFVIHQESLKPAFKDKHYYYYSLYLYSMLFK